MYNKIFTKILDSSIWLESTDTRIVWITLLAAMDQDGYAHFSAVENLAIRAQVSLESTKKALETLTKPDRNSADPEHEGRRIERVPGGFVILNAQKHKDIVTRVVQRENTRIRVARHREKNKPVTKCNDHVTPSYTEAEAQTNTKDKHNVEAKAPTVKIVDIETVLNFLNKKTGKNFQLKNPAGKLTSNALKIKDRMKDGYTIQQCKTVIARKCHDWLEKDKMKHCLTPETLFRKSNFDKYIGECVVEN